MAKIFIKTQLRFPKVPSAPQKYSAKLISPTTRTEAFWCYPGKAATAVGSSAPCSPVRGSPCLCPCCGVQRPLEPPRAPSRSQGSFFSPLQGVSGLPPSVALHLWCPCAPEVLLCCSPGLVSDRICTSLLPLPALSSSLTCSLTNRANCRALTPLLLTRSDRERDAAVCHSRSVGFLGSHGVGTGQAGQCCLLAPHQHQLTRLVASVGGSASAFSVGSRRNLSTEVQNINGTSGHREHISGAGLCALTLPPCLVFSKPRWACRAAAWCSTGDFWHEGGDLWGMVMCGAGGDGARAAPGWGGKLLGAPPPPISARSCCVWEEKGNWESRFLLCFGYF